MDWYKIGVIGFFIIFFALAMRHANNERLKKEKKDGRK
jgi:hypothetical protein